MIDREFQEVRVILQDSIFQRRMQNIHLPYAVLDGKKKSFESLWDKIIVNTGLARDDYVQNMTCIVMHVTQSISIIVI